MADEELRRLERGGEHPRASCRVGFHDMQPNALIDSAPPWPAEGEEVGPVVFVDLNSYLVELLCPTCGRSERRWGPWRIDGLSVRYSVRGGL